VSNTWFDRKTGVTPSRLWLTLIMQGHDEGSLDIIDAAILIGGWRPRASILTIKEEQLNLSEYVAYEGMHLTLNVTVFLGRRVWVEYCITVGHPTDRHYGKRLIEPYRRQYTTLDGLKRHLPKQVSNLRSIAKTHAIFGVLHAAARSLDAWSDPDGSISALVRQRMSLAYEDIAGLTHTWSTST
jgi:hypothetical protein